MCHTITVDIVKPEVDRSVKNQKKKNTQKKEIKKRKNKDMQQVFTPGFHKNISCSRGQTTDTLMSASLIII